MIMFCRSMDGLLEFHRIATDHPVSVWKKRSYDSREQLPFEFDSVIDFEVAKPRINARA